MSNSSAHTDFNPLSAQAERLGLIDVDGHNFPFQSTLCASRETVIITAMSVTIFISIHSLRKQRDVKGLPVGITVNISIHSLRKQRDADEG